MIEFNPSRQLNRRAPRFAACGLAAVAIVVAGLGVCVPTESTDSALAIQSSSVEGMPTANQAQDDLATVAAIPSSDHIAIEHVTNVLRNHGLLKDWFSPCLLGAEPQSWACVELRDKQRAIEVLNQSLKGTPFRGYVASIDGRNADAPWKLLAANLTYDELLTIPEFASGTAAGQEIRKHGNVFDSNSLLFGFESQRTSLQHVMRVSRIDYKYLGKPGWTLATEYRVDFASTRKNPTVTANVRVQVWNGGRSVAWHAVVNGPMPRVSAFDQFREVPPSAKTNLNPNLGTAFAAGYYIITGPLPMHPLRTFWHYWRFIPIYSSNSDVRARQLLFHTDDLRHILEIWERIWAMEMPDVETPFRLHGGVI
jgi:hypothetical protein